MTLSDVRPMSIGEILDRAVSTYVRRFVPLFVILAITYVPVAVIELLALPGFSRVGEEFAELNRLPPADAVDRNRVMMQIFAHANLGGFFTAFLLAPLVLNALARNAIVTFTDAVLSDAPITIRAAYRASFARWLPQIVATIGFWIVTLVVLGAILFMIVIIAVVAALAFGARYAGNTAGGIASLIILIPAFAIYLVVFAMFNVGWEMTSVSVALEDPNPFRAIGIGLRRAFDRAVRKRTIGVALAYVAVEAIGTLALLSVSALLAQFTHIDVLRDIVSALANILVSGVLAVFIVVYVRDVRLRREGRDLLDAVRDVPPLA